MEPGKTHAATGATFDMTVYQPDEPSEKERLQAALDQGKVLGMLKADFDIDQVLDEIEECETCAADPDLTPLDHWRHRKPEVSGR